MMHFPSQMVRLDERRNFVSYAVHMESEFTHLRPTGPHGMGWIVGDLNDQGAVGNALAGDADKGCAVAQHQVSGFIDLLRDVTKFDVGHFGPAGGRSEEHTSELQSLMRISYAVFCLKKKNISSPI